MVLESFILLAVCCCQAAVVLHQNPDVRRLFDSFNGTFSSSAEEQERFEIFRSNVAAIQEHNARPGVTFRKGVSWLTMLTQEEFQTTVLMRNTTSDPASFAPVPDDKAQLPPKPANYASSEDGCYGSTTSCDWRLYNVLSEVKDQGRCGSCWSFAATGLLESKMGLWANLVVNLSEQYLIDCSTTNHGCDGGWAAKALTWLSQQPGNGAVPDVLYPLNANRSQTSCPTSGRKFIRSPFQVISPVRTKVADPCVTSGDITALKKWVSTYGPVAVSVDSSGWQNYQDGIYTNSACSSTATNHAVLLVGFGSVPGLDYWIIKNSWGTDWGEKGYMRIDMEGNMCGVATRPVDVWPQ